MLKNYFLVAIRNLWRNKALSIINISGLAIGLACCMLIFLYTKDELSFHRFQNKKQQLYRITARMIDDKGHEVFKAGKIGSQLFTTEPEGNSCLFNIRISPFNTAQTLQFIEAAYKRLAPFYPFNYHFKSESNLRAYETEAKWKQIIGFAAMLTIFISCIGLLGLTALSAEQRTKEIGIRKVLGASVSSIVRLVSGNFLKLVLMANGIALPLAWWAVHQWLQNFAYHIDIQWWVFAIAVLITIAIAVGTIAFQAMKAAVASPVKNLRTE